MLAEALKKVRQDDFEGTDRRELVRLFWHCPHMARRDARIRIINDLPDSIQVSRTKDDLNDSNDIRGIVDACLNYPEGLKELMSILSGAEQNSYQFQDVENYLENFLQKKHIVAPDPEAERQIEQLTLLIVSISVSINPVDLEKIYHASAPQLNFSSDTRRYISDRNRTHVIDRILHHLNVVSVSELGIPPLLVFVERLACYVENEHEQQKLRKWIDRCIDNQSMPAWQVKAEVISAYRRKLAKSKQLAKSTDEPTQIAELFVPSLMIELEPAPADEKLPYDKDRARFKVKAWLKYGQEETACESLDVPQEYEICDSTQVLELLEIWLDKLDANATIEFFLHRNLFKLKVDEWQIPSEQGKMLGTLYRVVLRSSERFVRPISRAKSVWKENWARSKNFQPGQDMIKWLSDMKEYDGESLYYKLTNEKKIVLWLFLSPFTIDPEDNCQVFFNMLRAGIPIAIWLKGPANGPEGEMLKTLFSKNSLSDWPRLIFEQRKEAAELLRGALLHCEDTEKIQHPGRCFTLFWDDPTRMPLEYTQKFQETGIRKGRL